jgi:hypothetical protein
MPRGKREGKITQKEMVQTAIQEKGWKAKPKAMQVFIKEKFNYDMAPNYISNYKSQLKKAGGKGGNGRRGRKAGGSLQVAHLEKVRELVSELGADQVKKLVDFLA